MQRTERLLAILLLLQARGKIAAHRLAQLLGVSTRTIYRDIDTLSLAHIPISMDHGRGGGYYLLGDYSFDSAIFTKEEAISLMLGAGMVGKHSLFADDDDLQRALLKLEAALPDEYKSDVRSARERVLFDTHAWDSHPPTTAYLDAIRMALLNSQQVELLYPCDGEVMAHWRLVDPYGLVYKGLSRKQVRTGVWYLVGFCHTCQEMQTFRVSYIENMHTGETPIEVEHNFDLHAYWRETQKQWEEQISTTEMVLRILPSAKHTLHGEYVVLREERDGSAIVRVLLESVEAAVSYALALGACAVVLTPAEVRDAVAMTAQTIVALYE